jgi:dynein heavy chain
VSGRNKQFFDALLYCVRISLNTLKKRFASHNSMLLQTDAPVFKIDIELEIPNVILRPELNQVQKAVNFVATEVLQSCKRVFCWGQDRIKAASGSLRSYFRDIASNKEIVKVRAAPSRAAGELTSTVCCRVCCS